MRKRIPAFLLAIAVIFSLSGCQYTLNSEYESATEHSENTTAIISDSGVALASSYDELIDAIMEMVESSTTVGKIRFHEYDGDPRGDTIQACMEIANDTPLGAYSVYYINNSVSKIVSDYQAQISITYKKTPRQINAIISTNSNNSIKDLIKYALLRRNNSLTVETSLDGINAEYVSNIAKEFYYSDGVNIEILPEIEVVSYPENSVHKIVEIMFEYPFSQDNLSTMSAALNSSIDAIRSASENTDKGKQLLKAFELLSEQVERCPSEGSLYVDNTAYGALVEGKATDIGMATAFKLIANNMGYECYTVAGRFKSIDHYWNIVKVGDYYYHCDPYNAAEKSVAACFLRTDAEISREYWWETEKYKVCDGDLNYFIVSEIYEQQ